MLVLTAAYSGLRWGELSGLAVDSVDVLRGRISVERQLQLLRSGELVFAEPKSEAGFRTVTLPRTLAQELGVHFGSDAVKGSGLAFPTLTGKPMRPPGFQMYWRKACESVGLDVATGGHSRFTFHELRQTAVALAVEQGAHPLTIKERMGHSSISVTMDTYGGLFPSMDEALAQALDGVLLNPRAASARPEPEEQTQIRRSDA
jgi:integrase